MVVTTIFDAKLGHSCDHLIGGPVWSRTWTTTPEFQTWVTQTDEDAVTVPNQVQIVVGSLSGSAVWRWQPTGASTQLRTFAFATEDVSGSLSKFQLSVDGTIYPSERSYFTTSPVVFSNVFGVEFEVRLFQSRPSTEGNAVVNDFYLAGGGTKFALNVCPKCLATGEINDIIFDELGKIETVQREDKLGQELEKGVLILLQSNMFHEEVGSLLKLATTAPYAVDAAFRTQKLTQSIMDVVNMIHMQQQELKGVQDISLEETIKEVLNVQVSSEDDPRHLRIQVDILTESGDVYIYQKEVS